MKNYIKYEELSHSIKAEIERNFNNEKKKNNNLKIEDVMHKWFDESFDSWVQEHLNRDQKDDKREYYRLDIEIPVRIIETLIESSKEESTAMEFVGTIINISRGGLYFKSDRYVEVSSIIKVKIDLTKVDKQLKDVEALAMVLRSEKLNENEYGIGIMFSSIYDENKENLDLFIFRNIVHYIHLSKRHS